MIVVTDAEKMIVNIDNYDCGEEIIVNIDMIVWLLTQKKKGRQYDMIVMKKLSSI